MLIETNLVSELISIKYYLLFLWKVTIIKKLFMRKAVQITLFLLGITIVSCNNIRNEVEKEINNHKDSLTKELNQNIENIKSIDSIIDNKKQKLNEIDSLLN